MSIYDALAKYSTRDAIAAALIVFVASLLRLVAVPVALLALITGRALIALDAATAARTPTHPPRWTAANTRTRHIATV